MHAKQPRHSMLHRGRLSVWDTHRGHIAFRWLRNLTISLHTAKPMQPVPEEEDRWALSGPPKVCHFPAAHPGVYFLLHSQDCAITPLKDSFVTISPCPGDTTEPTGTKLLTLNTSPKSNLRSH